MLRQRVKLCLIKIALTCCSQLFSSVDDSVDDFDDVVVLEVMDVFIELMQILIEAANEVLEKDHS